MARLGYTRLQLIVLTHKYLAHYLFLNSHGVMRIGIQAGHLELKSVEREQMDLSVLPNNNHPEKFFQLDPKLLLTTHGFGQAEELAPAKRHLQDTVSSKVLCDKHS